MEMSLIQNIAIYAIPLLFAITLPAVAHGWVALWCGDQTAKLSDRLSLNPINHIDLVGTVIVPLLMLIFSNFIFGWAKPVPVDGRNLRHPRRDMIFVSLAGPLSNFVMALGWGALAWIGLAAEQAGNTWLGLPLLLMGRAGVMVNALLGVLNLLPLPPLDGGKVLLSILPPRWSYQISFIEPYSFFILLLLLVTGILNAIIVPPSIWLMTSILSLFGLPLF